MFHYTTHAATISSRFFTHTQPKPLISLFPDNIKCGWRTVFARRILPDEPIDGARERPRNSASQAISHPGAKRSIAPIASPFLLVTIKLSSDARTSVNAAIVTQSKALTTRQTWQSCPSGQVCHACIFIPLVRDGQNTP